MRPASRTSLASLRRPRAPFVCDTCLSRRIQPGRRLFSSSASRTSTPASSGSSVVLERPLRAGIAALTSRRLISVSGPDAAGFLQGVITSNINTPRASGGFYTAFLNAQGRLLHDVFIYPDTAGVGGGSPASAAGESFLIEVDAAEAERLTKHIRRYKLRAKFAIRLLDEGESTVWHAWNDNGEAAGGNAQADTSDANGGSNLLDSIRGGAETGIITMQDTRVPNLGYRILTRSGNTRPSPLAELTEGLGEAPEPAYQVRRYLHGVAEGQDELVREHALPQESNIELMGGVDFHKGCYVGQELTIRTRHRGVVRKRVLPCVLYDEAQPPPAQLAYRPAIGGSSSGDGDGAAASPSSLGAEMIPRDASIGRAAKKGRSAGKWLRGVGNVGLALCRLEIMTDVVLPGETAASTFRPDEDEFVLQQTESGDDREGGYRVKIKAFVPPWLRQGLAAEAAAAQH